MSDLPLILVYGKHPTASKSARLLRQAGAGEVRPVGLIDGESIWGADALVIPWTIQIDAEEGWRTLLREFVRSGRGLVLCHRSCGFYNEMDHSLFPEIAQAVDSWNDVALRVARGHEALEYPKGFEFTHGYLDHVQLQAGAKGTALALDARGKAGLVVGEHGRGRVAFMGNDPALARPSTEELKVFADVVRWVAGAAVKRPWSQAEPTVRKRIASDLSREPEHAAALLKDAHHQLGRSRSAQAKRFRQWSRTHSPSEESLRDLVSRAGSLIAEEWQQWPLIDSKWNARARGLAWCAWLMAILYRTTGEERWARIALKLIPTEELQPGSPSYPGAFDFYPFLTTYDLLREGGKVGPRRNAQFRTFLAGAADATREQLVAPSLRDGSWIHNLRLMPAVGLVRMALQMPEHLHALDWYAAGSELLRRHERRPIVYEDSNTYAPIDQNYLILIADDCLGGKWFTKSGTKRLFTEFLHVISPTGWIPNYGDSGKMTDAGISYLPILERAHSAWQAPKYRAAADRVLETILRVDPFGRLPDDPKDRLDPLGYYAYNLGLAWLYHTPGPARIRARPAVNLHSRVVLRTGWGEDDAYLMLGKRDGKYSNRGSWHGHNDALAISSLIAGRKVLLQDSDYQDAPRDVHHGLIVHRGEALRPLRPASGFDGDQQAYQEARTTVLRDGARLTIDNYDGSGVQVTRTVRLTRCSATITDRLVASESGTFTLVQPFYAPEVTRLAPGRYRFDYPKLDGQIAQPPEPKLEVTFTGPATRFASRKLETICAVRQVARVLVTRLQAGKPLKLRVRLDFPLRRLLDV